MRSEKDQAYWERNQLVCYLSKLFPSWIEYHPEQDIKWEKDWQNIVFIKFPEGIFSWHIHISEIFDFGHLRVFQGNSWDGTTTDEKYNKLKMRGKDK
jgi:hypothetical protein